MKKKIWIVLIIIVIAIQFVPTGRPDAISNNPNDILINNAVPDSVVSLLTTSCYDCHSNETVYPWYSYVAPVSWLISRDVNEGKRHMNFSEWESLDKMKKAEILDDLVDEVSDGGMPMLIYPLMHPEAKLTKADRQMIVDWAEAYGESLFE
jgi:hypothetical protein